MEDSPGSSRSWPIWLGNDSLRSGGDVLCVEAASDMDFSGTSRFGFCLGLGLLLGFFLPLFAKVDTVPWGH